MAKRYFAKVEANRVTKVLVDRAPDDYEEVNAGVSVGHIRDGQGGFTKPAPTLTEQREKASMNKIEFCIKFNELGVLPDAELIEGVSGGFPTTFADAIAHLSLAEQARIRGSWAMKEAIDRNSATLAFMAGLMSVTDAQLDEAFGITTT